MTYMLQEIHEQPGIIDRLCDEEYANALNLAQVMKERGIENISIVARGTSDNAGTFAKYLFEIAGEMIVSSTAPSVFTLYRSKLNMKKWLVIGISQSGESTDVVEVMKVAKKMGALTVGITNVPNSSLQQAADFTLFCHAGEEKSVAATKTYTATLTILYLLAAAITETTALVEGLKSAADAIRSVLVMSGHIERDVQRYRYMDECMVIARGINLATCQEAALKLLETCYVVAKPYSEADFQHGPIASIDEGFPVFLYAPPGKGYKPLLDLTEKLKEDGAEMIVISTEDEILSRGTTKIKLPVAVDEMFTPIVYIVVGQLFAQFLSLTMGYNPDQPRHLSKITRTM